MKKALATGAALSALAMAVATTATAQSDYPERSIEFIVAWPAGGATDLYTRTIAPVLSDILGVDIVVRNVSGAAGTVGTQQFTEAEADGYTLLQTPAGPITMQPHLRDTPYGPDDMEPICRLTLAPLALMVHPDSPYESVDDLVAAARERPGELAYGSAGAGTLPHVSMIGLEQETGIEMIHVPYQGSAPAMRALLGEEVDAVSEQANLVPRYELRALGVWSAERAERMPDIPTMKEQGVDLTFANWNAWFAPAGTPQAIIDTLAEACEEALGHPDVVEAIEVDQETPIAFLGPDELDAYFAEQFQVAEALLQAAGLTE